MQTHRPLSAELALDRSRTRADAVMASESRLPQNNDAPVYAGDPPLEIHTADADMDILHFGATPVPTVENKFLRESALPRCGPRTSGKVQNSGRFLIDADECGRVLGLFGARRFDRLAEVLKWFLYFILRAFATRLVLADLPTNRGKVESSLSSGINSGNGMPSVGGYSSSELRPSSSRSVSISLNGCIRLDEGGNNSEDRAELGARGRTANWPSALSFVIEGCELPIDCVLLILSLLDIFKTIDHY